MATEKKARKDTRYEFVDELNKIRSKCNIMEFIVVIDRMIEEAKAGEYHDYKNKKYTCGKMAASEMLRAIGQVGLAKRIEGGEFDEVADEEDKAEMRKECPPSMWKMLGL